MAKEEPFLKKVVELTYSNRLDLKIAACFTLKNMLFRAPKDIKD
jgi:hypothetical protein